MCDATCLPMTVTMRGECAALGLTRQPCFPSTSGTRCIDAAATVPWAQPAAGQLSLRGLIRERSSLCPPYCVEESAPDHVWCLVATTRIQKSKIMTIVCSLSFVSIPQPCALCREKGGATIRPEEGLL